MTQPGWYPDPQDPTQQRWWDGQRWGDVAPSPPQPTPPGFSPQGASTATAPNNYLPWSIINLVCLCLPLGIVALIFSLQVGSKASAGDIAGAEAASQKAKTFNLIASIVGAVILAGWGILLLTGGAATEININ